MCHLPLVVTAKPVLYMQTDKTLQLILHLFFSSSSLKWKSTLTNCPAKWTCIQTENPKAKTSNTTYNVWWWIRYINKGGSKGIQGNPGNMEELMNKKGQICCKLHMPKVFDKTKMVSETILRYT